MPERRVDPPARPEEGRQRAEPAEQLRRICYGMAGLGAPEVIWQDLPEVVGDWPAKAWDNCKQEWRLLVEPIRMSVLGCDCGRPHQDFCPAALLSPLPGASKDTR